MPTISKEKKEKISEQILHYLYATNPQPKFTSEIAKEIARDEEFTKYLLIELKSKSLVTEINKNQKGLDYTRRQRWLLSPAAYEIYSKHQRQ